MAWTVASRWVSPAKWSGSAGTMRGRRARVIVTGTSDAASDLTDQVLIPIANLNTMRGDVCTQIALRRVYYDAALLTTVRIEFDHGTDDPIMLFGSGVYGIDYTKSPLSDTLNSTDGTANLLLTTTGGAIGSRFTVDVEFNIK